MRRLTKEILKEPVLKCSYCGREFSKPVAHKCRGNFRKRHLKWINMAYTPASCDQICQGCEKNASGWCTWKDTSVVTSATTRLIKECSNILDSCKRLERDLAEIDELTQFLQNEWKTNKKYFCDSGRPTTDDAIRTAVEMGFQAGKNSEGEE